MEEYRDKHLPWARKFLARHDPAYRFRWDIYFEELDKLLGEAQSFLDAGCGDNQTVREIGFAGFKLGVDIAVPANRESFCCAKLDSLPFADGSFDIIGCRFVLEHLAYPEKVFDEFCRVLRPGGYLLTQTPNRRHPLVFLGRLLPRSVKQKITRWIYGRSGGTEFPTYHRFNRPRDFQRVCAGLMPIKSWFVEDLHLESKILFYISFAWHRLTGMLHRTDWRSSITTRWQKPVESQTAK
jgi:SAM-dependent methyltransferase